MAPPTAKPTAAPVQVGPPNPAPTMTYAAQATARSDGPAATMSLPVSRLPTQPTPPLALPVDDTEPPI